MVQMRSRGNEVAHAEEGEVIEVATDEEGGEHGDVEVVLLHHGARPSVDQEQGAAQGEVEHAAGDGEPDADGVQAPAAGGEAGAPGRAGSG